MRYVKPTQVKFPFKRSLLPQPEEYFQSQGLKITGGGTWKNALCPFHNDTNPSLRVHLDTGGFRCMACGVKGGDILAFHMQRYGVRFAEAVRQLGAWEVKP
jgi:DNA primase